jgi:diguanylate cyclase (GGDEF)-like protein
VKPADSRMFLVIHYVTYVGIVAHTLFIPLFAWLGVPFLAAFNVYSVASWVAARVANRRFHHKLAILLLFLEVISHAVLATWFLGWQSGFHYYLIPVIPFLLFNDQLNTRLVVATSLAVAALYVTLRLCTFGITHVAVAPNVLHAVEGLNMLVPFSALGVMSIYFRFASLDVERRMEALAMTDALTTLPNRRRMREMLDEERVRFTRSRRSFGLIIGDIDGFKHINDHAGHDCGDHVLRELAQVLRQVLRAQDVVARWGGEEFLFLLPDTDLTGAAVVAEKLRGAVERAELRFADKPMPVTMTFGVAAFVPDATIEECIRQADQAMYSGKEQGKNRVVTGLLQVAP